MPRRNYLRCSFWCDFLSSLPLHALYLSLFDVKACDEKEMELAAYAFHFLFLMKFLRFASLPRMKSSFADITAVS